MVERIAVTSGEPAGIGPDLVVMHAQRGCPHELVTIGDPQLFHQRASALNLSISIRGFNPDEPPRPLAPKEICVSPIALVEKSVAGKLNVNNSSYVLNTLSQAVDLAMSNQVQAIVTAPVHKGIINDSGIAFSGHTEFFAEKTHTPKVVMMLATEGLRVALVTTHLPLAKVATAITADEVSSTLRILHHSLQTDFGIADPNILVCGLNPHAGEGGHLGREEIDIIEPVLQQLRSEKIPTIGPLPADTLFTQKYLDNADCVLAMYHDQGLPVLKYKGFGNAANITLGMPIVRTSVDHGTALDLAGTGNIDGGSFTVAVNTAIDMAVARRTSVSR